MKKMIWAILLFNFCTSSSFALERKTNSVESKSVGVRQLSNKSTNRKENDFDLKDVFTDQDEFEEFMVDSLSIIEIKSANQISKMIDTGTKDLFVHKYFKDTPLISEFLYQSFKEPKVLSKFFSILIQRNSLFVFSIAILFSIVISYYLGEFKYKFPPLSFKRVSYSLFRFLSINGFRVWVFTFLFIDHLKPITQVYMASIATVKEVHPTLYGISNILTQYI